MIKSVKFLAFAMLSVIALAACSTAAQNGAGGAPSTEELAAARAGIEPHFQEMFAAANAHDTDRHLASYLHSPALVFVANDQEIHGWDALREQQLKWWQNGKSDAVYTVVGEPEYTMPARDVVLQTYFLDSHRAGADTRSARLSVTDVWQKRAEGWRVIYAHESVVVK